MWPIVEPIVVVLLSLATTTIHNFFLSIEEGVKEQKKVKNWHRDSSFELIVLAPHCMTLVRLVSTPSMMALVVYYIYQKTLAKWQSHKQNYPYCGKLS